MSYHKDERGWGWGVMGQADIDRSEFLIGLFTWCRHDGDRVPVQQPNERCTGDKNDALIPLRL